MNSTTDDALVEAFRRGDKSAAELLVRRYSNRLYGYLFRLAGAEAAPDLLQETFLTFFAGLGNYRSLDRLGGYLFRIAASRARDHHRRSGRSETRNDLHLVPDRKADPHGLVQREEERGRVRRAVLDLAPNQREVVLLAEYEGMDYASIASTVGCTLGAVKQRLFRARVALKERLGPWLGRSAPRRGEEANHVV